VEEQTSSDDAEKSKPHPDIFEAALSRLELAPDRGIVIGDTPKGRAAEKFKELSEKYTDGKVRVEVHANSTLYKDKEELEALQVGAVEAADRPPGRQPPWPPATPSDLIPCTVAWVPRE